MAWGGGGMGRAGPRWHKEAVAWGEEVATRGGAAVVAAARGENFSSLRASSASNKKFIQVPAAGSIYGEGIFRSG
jgi:hypothetical protein